MSVTIAETPESRTFTVGPSGDRELTYVCTGSTSESDVEAALRATAPTVYSGLVLYEVSAESLGNGVWKGRARYRSLETEYTFRIGGGQRHVTQSLATIASYAPAGLTAPDYQGAIGVTDDAVEGVDLPAAFPYVFTETHQFEDATITPTYLRVLANLAGRTQNDDTFRSWNGGEVALLGVTGNKRIDEKWSLTFEFGVSLNETGLSVGTITGIDKLGCDYLWVRYATTADMTAVALVPRPVAAYVERVLVPADYDSLLI